MRPWTKEEDRRLEELLQIKSYRETAEILDRSLNAIYQRKKILKIKSTRDSKRYWTEQDDEYLSENWGRFSMRVLMKNLDRSEIAILQRAYQVLKLGPARESTDYIRISEFVKLSGISRDRIINTLVPKYDFPIIRKATLNRRDYFIDLELALSWLESHQSLYDASKISESLFVNEPAWLKEKRRFDKQDKSKIKSYAVIKNWTVEDNQKLADLVKIGYSYDELAKLFQITRSQIERQVININASWTSPTFWKGEEFKYIKEHWQTMSDKEMAKHLRRSVTSIIKHRISLGLLRTANKKHWTESEDEYLKEFYKSQSDIQIGNHLNRPVDGVISRRLKLGLKRTEDSP